MIPFQKGDRVQNGEPGSDEYDTGTVVSFTKNGDRVRVYWDGADEIYEEWVANLRPLVEEGV